MTQNCTYGTRPLKKKEDVTEMYMSLIHLRVQPYTTYNDSNIWHKFLHLRIVLEKKIYG